MMNTNIVCAFIGSALGALVFGFLLSTPFKLGVLIWLISFVFSTFVIKVVDGC